MSMAASSSSSWKYDVFLNFRGEDTRKIFAGHLYRALNQKAINTFIDAEKLRKGNDLSELLSAIEESRLSIVVFSQNYASSTWCLKELVKILACMDTKNQIVVPIFYQVDPSEVRKLKRSFAEAFAQHERESNAEMEEVKSWRSALTRATNLSGWDSRKYEDDAKLIEEIVDDIFKRLNQVSSSKDNGLVGMDYHMDEVNSLLRPEVNDVFTVGIWGMGGIGKTTIAHAVYDEIACQFEACCFLENVKEGFSKNGAVHMQEVLLSRILKEKVQSLGTLDQGSRVIMERLQRKKVFIVLDDVDELSQIEGLLGKQHSFGSGSRVIITTRDRQLLSGAVAVYKPKNLSEPEALQLFKRYAFRTNQPTKVYDQLSRHVVQYAQHLPLALKVLGAFLHNKTVREWEDVLEKIRKIPQRGIHDVLKTSFNGLDDSEKDIFLDIACFFKGMDIDTAKKSLDSCGFYPHTGIRVLIDRALISVSMWGTLEMHDLLEEMGREIVRQECIKEPGRRSRLWSYEDVRHVLTQNTATEAVEGIILDSAIFKEGCSNAEAFVSMTKLRLLMIRDCFIEHWIADLKFQSSQLRCLVWRGCPLKSWPSNFQFKNLVNLDMMNSCIEQLWKGAEPLEKLKFINLSYCEYLKKTPDFTKATSLEELNFEGCTGLYEVDPSISALKSLAVLNLRDCRELKSLPSSIHMGSLQTFILSGCSNLEKFPDISDVMESLSELHLDETAIKELPLSINKLTGLTVLDLCGCQELKSLPSSIHMGSLQTLNLRGCRELKSLPSSIHMGSLQTLNLSGCSNLEMFPEISEVMEKLSKLHLDGTAIKELSSSINKLTGLTILDLRGCRELKSLPSSIHMGSLQTLNLSGCANLDVFPDISEVMEKLSKLHLDGTAIKELSSSINKLTGLTILDLRGCRELKSLPSSIHMGSLQTLNLSGCLNLEMFPEISEVMEKLSKLHLDGTAIKELSSSINKLTGLTILDLRGCRVLKSLPSSIHMGSLQTLNLSGCSDLEKFPDISDVMEKLSKLYLDGTAIKELPSSINKLTGLTVLDLFGCQELKSLPSNIHMRFLQTLNLSGCSNLEKFPEISDVMEKISELDLDGTAIKELPSSIRNIPRLLSLKLRDCKKLKSLPSSICDLKSLQYVGLSGCAKFEVFPNIVEKMRLRELHLHGTSIKRIPPSIECLHGLVLLNLRNCKSLGSLPEDLCNLVSLTVLTLSGCSKLQNLPEKLGKLESLWNLEVEGSGIKQLPLSLLRLNKLTKLSCHGCKEMTAPFSSWSTSMEDCSHRGLVYLDLSDCNLLQLSGIAHLSSLKTLDLCRNNFESLPAEMNRLHRLTDLKLEGCKRLKSIPELSSSISFIDAHDCTALESVSRPKLPYMNLYFTFSNCFQLVQNQFEYIVEAHQFTFVFVL
nr:protein SUPPRESSOR OF npr1-1, CONSTITUTIVE 1-like isoform X2 [Malus domestica]